MVEAHGDFQMLYYGHHLEGFEQNKRERHRGHKYFDDCAEFCERWDQSSFDPNYPSLSLNFFRPLVREVFARAAYDPAILAAPDQPLLNAALAAERGKVS